MARITVEDCLEEGEIDNRFALVLLAAQRTRQLMSGARATVENPHKNKMLVMSLREIAAGNIYFDGDVRESLTRGQSA